MSKPLVDEFEESDFINSNANPLAKYFRVPGLSVSLPTDGKFFNAGEIEFNIDGTLDVYPMRGADEILLSSPDALMNNKAVIELIRSCVPQIKVPEHVSIPDLDLLLLAIKVASTGDIMKLDVPCPKCKEVNTYDLNVPSVIATAKKIDAINTVRLNDEMVAQINPHILSTQTKIMMDIFATTRQAQAIELMEIDEEEKMKRTSVLMDKINTINMYGIKQSVVKIIVPDQEVTKREYIDDFIDNANGKMLKLIKGKIEELNNGGVDKTFEAECVHCNNKWTASIEFDPAAFFGLGSQD